MATQVLPSDDSFDPGADAPGSYLAMYLGCRVATTTANAPVAWGIRLLHSGYQTIGSDGVNSTPAAMLGASESISDRIRPGAMLFRSVASIADVTVTATFRQFATVGNANYALIAPCGVLARVQGGSLSGDGTLAVRYDDPSCYVAYYRGRASLQTIEFVLARVNAGAFTTLALTSKASSQFSAADLARATKVSLTATTTSGDVSLSATFTGLGQASPIVMTTTDTSASVLTGVGRCGFTCGRDHQNAPGTAQVVDLVDQFSILSGSSVVVDDRFERHGLSGAYDYSGDATYSDTQGNDGRSLQMAYTWDQFTGGDETPRLEQSGDDAVWTGSASDSAAVLAAIASRPASNIRSQRRAIDIYMPSQPAAGQHGAGIILRASQPAPVAGTLPLGVGYFGWFYWSAGGTTTPTFALARHRVVSGSSVVQIVATYADTGDMYTNGFAAWTTFDLEVYNREGSSSNGPSLIIMRTDLGAGLVQIPLVASGTLGVTTDSDGTVTDESSSRISTGGGEGIAIYNTQGDTLAVSFDNWTQKALTNADLADRDQASVVVAGEGTATGADLSTIIGVDYPLRVERQHFSIVDQFESGHRRANPRFTDSTGAGIPRSSYSCSVRGIRPATLSTFLDYWHDHAGAETAFPWTPPGEASPITGHFVEDSLRYALTAVGTYALSFKIEELL